MKCVEIKGEDRVMTKRKNGYVYGGGLESVCDVYTVRYLDVYTVLALYSEISQVKR